MTKTISWWLGPKTRVCEYGESIAIYKRYFFVILIHSIILIHWIPLQLCGYEADIEPPMVYGENDSSINISSNLQLNELELTQQLNDNNQE